jgi:hypothetical protein
MKALNGTGVELEVELLLLEPLPLVPVERDALALWDAADPELPDNKLPLPEDADRAEVELTPDRLVLERLRTPDDLAVKDEPLLLEVGDSRLLAEEAEEPAPAPEEDPAVFEATVIGVPLAEA